MPVPMSPGNHPLAPCARCYKPSQEPARLAPDVVLDFCGSCLLDLRRLDEAPSQPPVCPNTSSAE